jgi:hypothetical protein
MQMKWLCLVVFVECCGLVACGVVKIPGVNVPAKTAVFNTIEVGNGYMAREFRLSDGTHCVAIQQSITCDWNNK